MSKLPALGCLLVLAAVGAKAQKEDRQWEVVLRLQSEGTIPLPVVAPAKAEASAVLRKAGIQVRWESATGRSKRETRECSGEVVDVIDVLLLDKGLKRDHPGAFGYALPFAKSGVRVVIFYDRVVGALTQPSPTLLGYAMAHEVGHLLIGTLKHTSSGVMAAHWGGLDYNRMNLHTLAFTDDDSDTIRQRVRQKTRSCMAEAAVNSGVKAPAAEE